MPTLARLLIRTALGYLALALALGVALALGRVVGPAAPLATLHPAWVHLLVVGWLTQLIFGVAYWLFPRWSRERPYGRSGLAWGGYALLNAGLALRVVAEPAVAWGGGMGWNGALVASAGAQAVGVFAFVGSLWGRIRQR